MAAECGSSQQSLRDRQDVGSCAGCRSRGSKFLWNVLCSVQSFQRLSPLTQQTMVRQPHRSGPTRCCLIHQLALPGLACHAVEHGHCLCQTWACVQH